MSKLNLFFVQKAIYEKMIASSDLVEVVSRIFDGVAEDAVFPYITIGNISVSDSGNLAKNGAEYIFDIHIWSREAGNKQAGEIMDIIYRILHNSNLVVDGQEFVYMQLEQGAISIMNDGITRHGILKLRAVLSDAI